MNGALDPRRNESSAEEGLPIQWEKMDVDGLEVMVADVPITLPSWLTEQAQEPRRGFLYRLFPFLYRNK
jgi:hypothetical protein